MNKGQDVSDALDRLFADLGAILADSEGLVNAGLKEGDEAFVALRAAMVERFDKMKAQFTDAKITAPQSTKTLALAVDDYVRAHPWRSVCIAGGVVGLLGFLVGRAGSGRQ